MRRSALGLGLMTVGGALAALQLWLIVASWSDRVANDWYWRPFALMTVAIAVVYLAAGVLVLRQRPDNRIGLVLAIIGVTVLLYQAVSEYALRGLLIEPGSLPASGEIGVLSQTLWIIPFSLVPVLMLLYPTGRLLAPSWRWAAAVPAVSVALLTGVGTVVLWPLRRAGAELLDLDPGDFGTFGLLVELVVPLLFVALVAGIVSIAIRWRRSAPLERQQIKWLFPAGLIMVAQLVLLTAFQDEAAVASEVLLLSGLVSVPIVISLAILRYRLFDIDRLISRTVSYVAVTVALAGIYVGLVFVLRTVLPFEGQLAVAASTLTVAAMFHPVRRRVQSEVDRRFNRSRYDASLTMEAFSNRMRSDVDLAGVGDELCRVATTTMNPTSISIWLRSS